MKSVLVSSEHDDDIDLIERLVRLMRGATCERLGLRSPTEHGDIMAVCTWGDGPDVLLTLRGHPILLLEDPDKSGFRHGVVRDSQMDLTRDEATALSIRLQAAVRHVEALEALCDRHS